MTVQQMRDAILPVYDIASWKRKVANMYDDQVIAIYHNFAKRGVLNKVLKRERPVATNALKVIDGYVPQEAEQLTIFDLLN